MNDDRLTKIAALTWYDFDAMPAEDIGAIVKELLDAVAERDKVLELCRTLLGNVDRHPLLGETTDTRNVVAYIDDVLGKVVNNGR